MMLMMMIMIMMEQQFYGVFLDEVGLSICAKCVREARTPGFFLNFFSEFGEK
jgi:hypothetical protein